jgi:hypothetical protein
MIDCVSVVVDMFRTRLDALCHADSFVCFWLTVSTDKGWDSRPVQEVS